LLPVCRGCLPPNCRGCLPPNEPTADFFWGGPPLACAVRTVSWEASRRGQQTHLGEALRGHHYLRRGETLRRLVGTEMPGF
jgi:hypothetical protein